MDESNPARAAAHAASSGSLPGSEQDHMRPQREEGVTGGGSNSTGRSTSSTTPRKPASILPTPSASTGRRHPSVSSSLSNVTNYGEEGESEVDDTDDVEESKGSAHQASDAALFTSQAEQLAGTRPSTRPITSLTRAVTGLPLAATSMHKDESEKGDAASKPLAAQGTIANLSSGITQQRLAASVPADETISRSQACGNAERISPSSSQPIFSNITHSRTYTPSLGAYSQSSASSLDSSSSPTTSHSYSNASGPIRLGKGTLSEGAFSPTTSIDTGMGSSAAVADLQATEHTQQSAALPIAIPSSRELANIGIGIPDSQPVVSSSIPTSSLAAQVTSVSPTASPAPVGPASLPQLSSMSASSGPNVATSASTRLSSMPFLPSPLAQASLAPGEEDGEHMEVFGLDAALIDDDKSGHMAFPLKDRGTRIWDASASGFPNAGTASVPLSLRRSSSVSHGAAYKAPNSRRRISSISQQQEQSRPGQTKTTSPPPVSAISPPGIANALGTSANTAAAAANLQRSGSPSPLRKEASLLSASRIPALAPTQPSIIGRTTGANNGGSASSDAYASTLGVTTHSPTPRPVTSQQISTQSTLKTGSFAPLHADLSSAGSNSSPNASSSSDSPVDYRFPSPHQPLSGVSGPTLAFRSRQTSVSSSGSGGSASSAQLRAQAGQGGLHHSPTIAIKSLSPPSASLSMSASSPGLSYHVPSGSHRSNSLSVHNRGTHGRSDSLTSVLGMSTTIASSPSSVSSTALSTSPSTSFRPFPSAPPVATPSAMSASSFNFSPSSSGVSPAVSPPGTQFVLQPGSPSTSLASSMIGKGELTASAAGVPGTSSAIRLQRVPTSVRLAQELHLKSPVLERRRLSIDPNSTISSAGPASASSLSAFKIGGSEEQTSSSSSGSETEYKTKDTAGARLGLRLPATPMATRRNSPSPSGCEEDAEATLRAEDTDEAQFEFEKPASTRQARVLASPFSVYGDFHDQQQGSPSRSPRNISPSNSSRSLSIPTPPLHNTSAYAPLFPFSVPNSAARSTVLASAGQPGPASSPPSLSRSHSRSRFNRKGSPVFNRLSPRMSSDPFGNNDAYLASSEHSQLAEETISTRTSDLGQGVVPATSASSPLAKRNTISGLAPSTTSSSLFGLVRTSSDSPLSGGLSPSIQTPLVPAGEARITPPDNLKKQFRTSMVPGSIATSSTEDYARHLQESRASKIRKWAAGNTNTDETMVHTGGAGNTIGAASDVQAGGSKARRRAGIPDFPDYNNQGIDRTGRDYRDELTGDLGVRPGTAGSREIEWVDWLDEYKKMKEAKIKAEQERERQQGLENLEEALEAEGEDIALDLGPDAFTHARNQSDERSSHDPLSRRSSAVENFGHKMPFPGSYEPESSPGLGSMVPPRPRRLSTASLASLSLLDASKRKRTSQDSLASIVRPAIPAAVVPRKVMAGRSISYAPPTAYSAVRQEEHLAQPSALPKKRKNIASKIDAWWSAVTKSFSSASDEKKSPPPPPPPMSIPAPAAMQGQLPRLPQIPPLTSDHLMPAVSIDPADLPGRVSAQYARGEGTLPVPPSKLRHTASASDLTPEKKIFSGGQLPTGALAPAARVSTLNMANSEGDALSGSVGASRGESRRRNPHLSLRLDPRFQPAGTAHRLGDRPSVSRTSSTSWSSSSGPPSQPGPMVFKEPRLPSSTTRQEEQTPSLTPGQSPIWDRTPGLVPVSQTQDFRLVRSMSKSSSLAKTPANAPLAPSFSMTHIRQHIQHRLTGAKHNCDKELKKIITGITVYVEKELENERAFASGLVSRQEEESVVLEDRDYSESPAPGLANEEKVDLQTEGQNQYGAKPDYSVRPGLQHTVTGSSSSSDPSRSGIASPTLTGAPQSHNRIQPTVQTARRGRTSGHSSPRRASMPSKRHPLGAPIRPADLAARLERSLDMEKAGDAPTSRTASTSTSRSRSPMPHAHGGSAVNRTSSAEWFKKHEAPDEDDKRNFLHSLQEIVSIAMEIQETSVADLTDDPSTCAQLIRRVQKIGQRWDDHPNWPLRGWYVQLLLAVAGLSRVAEFWAEERGFWNFEEQKDANENEPILFVAKAPAADEDAIGTGSRPRAGSTVLATSRTPAREDRLSLASSPLGVDLGIHRIEEDAATDTSLTVSAPIAVTEETSRAEEAEVLREAVEEVRSATIMMELALDGVSFQYLSPVWEDVVGLPPDVCLGRPISHLLHPDDAAVFTEASRHLQQDDSHTIEAQFRLRVFGENEDPDDHTAETFEAMEGKGMLIRDRVHGEPSHTMWVIRPVPSQGAPSDDGEATTVRPATASYIKSFGDSIASFAVSKDGRLPVQPILCRICDRQIPTWFFEKHNETCNETHRLEVDISETNDKLADLRTTINSILQALKESITSTELYVQPDYQDSPLLPIRYRDSQIQFLEEMIETLNKALQISTPSLADDHLPVESQGLLSPTSEGHLSFLHTWQIPKSEDPALRRLGDDMAELCRQKMTVVNRLRNTIIYAERVRLEWESQAEAVLAGEPKAASSESLPPSPAATILPSMGDATALSTHENVDQYENPTPVLPKTNTFLAQGATIPVQQIPDRDSPVSFENVSPAGLLQPLPLIDPGFNTSNGNLASSQSMTLSPSLIPTSPRISTAAPARTAKPSTSIKDFDIIKPISKGAFGSVYLAKKRNTGDYYAIKVLKKADMIAKNQVTNVKAERKIMMTQADSDFAVKLYWTFQSKDYLYLVMEYLNGGDCASLIKVIGCLDEDWAKSYVAEIVLGLEYLHGRGIVHRDLKPDNLLIDSRGHLRLTDFGLSRFGLLGRQARTINQSSSQLSRRLHRRATPKSFPQAASENSTPDSQPRASYFSSINPEDADAMSESSGSESVADKRKLASRKSDSPAISMGSNSGKILPHVASPGKQSDSHRFVGTVDYVAPESILGVGVGEGVDWWALGVICHEFLTSFPPFHADTPEQVFDNILSRRINWHDEDVEWSHEARDFVDKLLCPDPSRRLGVKGAEEVKRHPFLRGIDWTKLREAEGNFVPQVTDPESTDYFDDRGAATQVFQEDDVEAEVSANTHAKDGLGLNAPKSANAERRESMQETSADDFGTFSFKNLDVLKQANDDVIRKLRSDSVIPTIADSSALIMARKRKPKSNSIVESRLGQPPSPSTSTTSSIGSAFSRPSLPTTPFTVLKTHKRVPSNQHNSRSKDDGGKGHDGHAESSGRRSSMPSNFRRASFGTTDRSQPAGGNLHQRRKTSGNADITPASSISSPTAGTVGLPGVQDDPSASTSGGKSILHATEKTVDCLIAEDNPISSKILETILVRLGCLCVVVHNGEEAIRCSMGELAFDVIFMDMLMPILDGENAARMIKSTNNANQHTPIVAVTSYAAHERIHITEEGTLFNAVLSKPVSKMDVLNVLTKLGFVTKTKPGATHGDSGGPTAKMNMIRRLPADGALAV